MSRRKAGSAETRLRFSTNSRTLQPDYAEVTGSIQKTLDDGSWLDRIKLQGKFSKDFRDQYKLAEKIAKGENSV